MLMAVLGPFSFHTRWWINARTWGPQTSGIVIVAGGSSVRLVLVLVLAAVVIAVGS